MAIRTLKQRSSLLFIRAEIHYTLRKLSAHPLTKHLAPDFAVFRQKWDAVFSKELAIRDAIAEGHALVDTAGDDLDDLASSFSKLLLIITGDKPNHSLYTLYFGRKTLTRFRRPVLGKQLLAMQAWPKYIKETKRELLVGALDDIVARLAAAESASTTRDDAVVSNKEFRIGERYQFISEVNVARKILHAALSAIAHRHAGLPNDFADRFFRHESVDEDEDEGEEKAEEVEPTTATVAAAIASLKEQLAKQTALYEDLDAKEKAAALAAAELAKKRAELAEIERVAAEMKARADALRAALTPAE